ncbi:MAG: glycosyltransferase [Steroidobacteraceae bacterium]
MILVPSLRRAGAETQAIDLANGLSSLGHHVHLCSFEPQLDQRARLQAAVQFHYVPRKTKYDIALVGQVAAIIDRQNIEVVQGIMQFAVLIAWLAARQSCRKPAVVAAVHTTVNRGLKEELQDRVVYRWLFRRLPAIVFVCNYQRDHWVRKYAELKPLARVVHNGVDVNRFRRSDFAEKAESLRSGLAIPNSAFVFASIAAFRPEKYHRGLVEAFAQLPTNTHLLFAGDGPERPAIEVQVRSMGLADRAHFMGVVADIRPVIVASNATVLSSIAVETFSMAMLESMALQVPMVATDIGGLGEAISHQETGLLCPLGDVGALAHQMSELVKNPAIAARLGRAAADRVSRCFTLEKMVEASENVLIQVLGAGARGQS